MMHKMFVLFASLLVGFSNTASGQSGGVRPELLEVVNPNPVGSGARALGMANAFIGVADDATAAFWNPAGAFRLQTLEISCAWEAIAHSERLGGSGDDTTVRIEDLNFASVVLPYWKRRNFVFSLNYLELYRFDRDFGTPFDFAVSSSLQHAGVYDFRQRGAFSVLAPSMALEVSSRLALGITINVWNDDVTGNSSFSKTESLSNQVVTFNGNVFGVNSVFRENRFTVDDGYSIVAGAMFRLTKDLSLSGVVKPAFDMGLDRRLLERTVNDTGQSTTMIAAATSADLEFPWIIGLGAAWQPNDVFTAAWDVTWTDWSNYRVDEGGGEINPVTGSPDALRDTFTMRLGCEFVVVTDRVLIPLRCGIGYDPSPAVSATDEYVTLNAGTGIQFTRFALDLGYEFRFGNDVNGDNLAVFGGDQDVRQHRILASMIVYF